MRWNSGWLIGSPPGYVGHGEGGELTERVRRRPYSVVLFDEIEKAHPDVMHMLLQILEEGRITDTLGRKIDFSNTIIIMTSNVGAELLAKGSALGFGDAAADEQKTQDRLLAIAKKTFKPEFINRLDEIVVFGRLSGDDLIRIVDIELGKLGKRLAERGLAMRVSDGVKKFIIAKGSEPEFGARPLRRAVVRFIEDPLSEELLRGRFAKAAAVAVDLDEDKIVFSPLKK